MIPLPRAESEPTRQMAIPRVDAMRNLPQDFEVPDWRAMSRAYVDLVFDLDAKGEHLPLVWIDDTRVNEDEETFGLYVTVADPRCGPNQAGGAYHDSVNDLAAVLTGTLAGVDMTRYRGRNWVRMCRAIFNRANGRNVFMEFTREFDPAKTGGGYGRDFWYDVLPSVLAMELGSLYPDEPSLEEPLRQTADQFVRATDILLATPEQFAWSTFDWKAMRPVRNFIPVQPDAAGGFANLLLLAHHRFGSDAYLRAALRCLETLDAQQENPLYDAMLPEGVYAMARANAEHDRRFDVAKALGWCFAGGTKCVEGVHAGTWGAVDVSGIVEMRLVERLYACETFKMAKSLTPIPRYDPRFARAIGKWLTNAASNMRRFYPDYLPPHHQMAYEYRDLTRGVIGYEAITTRSMWGDRPVPFAERDDWRNTFTPPGEPAVWPKAGHYSLYGSSYVGFFAGIGRTGDPTILEVDCLHSDFGRAAAYPTHLYYNPHVEPRQIAIEVGVDAVDLYDLVGRAYLARSASGRQSITLGADSAAVVVRVPAGTSLEPRGRQTLAGGVVVDFGVAG